MLLWLAVQAPAACSDVASCRTDAEAAAARGDFETFHDLAWRAVQKGKRNDTDLMLLLARAQSLSGRPDDALVMLERIAALGGKPDIATNPDFARVRQLPRFSELAAKLSPSVAESASASASAPRATADKSAPSESAPVPSAPASTSALRATVDKPAAT